jgi:ArsR family metal-binding transcriptional regulator
MITYAIIITIVKGIAKMKNKKTMNIDEINAKKNALDERINESIEQAKNGRKSPAKEFLAEISDSIKKAIDNGVSYTQLSKDIYAVYNFKVSEQTIRAFAHLVLGVPKRKKSATAATAAGNGKVLKTSSQIKEESAKKKSDSKELSL